MSLKARLTFECILCVFIYAHMHEKRPKYICVCVHSTSIIWPTLSLSLHMGEIDEC